MSTQVPQAVAACTHLFDDKRDSGKHGLGGFESPDTVVGVPSEGQDLGGRKETAEWSRVKRLSASTCLKIQNSKLIRLNTRNQKQAPV
jgi:hypothetical protein